MNKILSLFKRENYGFDFNKIIFGLISPELIEARSYGVVKKSETINYRTYKPERDGLFCAKIFGPIKDYECLCGKYKRLKHRGVICEKCGVEVTFSKVRRNRMAHIELACPVAHIWFFKALPSRIGLLLDLSMSDIEKVLYYESYIVVNAGDTNLEVGTLLDENAYLKLLEVEGNNFSAKMGAEAILEILVTFDLNKVAQQLKHILKGKLTETKLKKLRKRLQLVEMFLRSGNKPEWMILTILPVLPPDLRPLVPLEGGRFASSDLNDLYRRVINRNNRLKRLLELNAPDIIVRNEKRMLQEAVDALFDNGRRSKPVLNSTKRQLKSLSDIIKGKHGRFRQNLLGKRVDYSGRSVIVVGPSLKLHQCGLPKQMALELFKPFVLSKLEMKGIANIKLSKKLIEEGSDDVYSILEEVVKEYPILLNRAPTLHRLGIQSFEPVLIEGKALQLHPLVCVAFNADFDGDQMAVHVPLSIEAQLEARVLLLSTRNILSPANGRPTVVPSQDILLGLHYLTLLSDRINNGDLKFFFYNCIDVYNAFEHNLVDIHTNIILYVNNNSNIVEPNYIQVETTVGRVLFFKCCSSSIPFTKVNVTMTKEILVNFIEFYCKEFCLEETIVFCDSLMHLGFYYATQSGVSICIDDLVVPNTKETIVAKTILDVKVVEKQYSLGLLTQSEKYNRVVDLWSVAVEDISMNMLNNLLSIKSKFYRKDNFYKIRVFNSIYLMLYSGARGSIAQLRQLAGIRGLMAKPDGSIIETPIISNFREGLNILQYFISTHGSRKGLIDTALKTANSGYLTRRLVDVAQDVVITEDDCGSVEGIKMSALIEGSDVILDLGVRIFGRILCNDIYCSDNKTILLKAGSLLTNDLIELIRKNNIEEVIVRSVIMCLSKKGVCSYCYGIDLSRNCLINKGEAVGVIAAQSIGEPGTQLTMRTFHIGGVAFQKAGVGVLKVNNTGIINFSNIKTVYNKEGQCLVVSKYCFFRLINADGKELEKHTVPYGAELFFSNNVLATSGSVIASWNPHSQPIITEVSGKIYYIDLIENVTIETKIDEMTGIPIVVVIDIKNIESSSTTLNPAIEIRGENDELLYYPGTSVKVCYFLTPGTLIDVSDNIYVHVGDIIARVIHKSSKVRDITGGLPKIADLFEARIPKKNAAVLAVASGVVSFLKEKKGKVAIIITDNLFNKHVMFITKTQDICVYEGEVIKRGDIVVEGVLNPHDLLALVGISCVANHILNEVQAIYRLQGVYINDKHIEIILRQMLSKVLITESGDSFYRVNQIAEFSDVNLENLKLTAVGKNVICFSRLLLGITKSSLLTNSFISAASFQETTKVLTDAAICGKKDFLYGLKENVIIGRLIPAGTGFEYHNNKKQSLDTSVFGSTNLFSDAVNLTEGLDFTLNSFNSLL